MVFYWVKIRFTSIKRETNAGGLLETIKSVKLLLSSYWRSAILNKQLLNKIAQFTWPNRGSQYNFHLYTPPHLYSGPARCLLNRGVISSAPCTFVGLQVSPFSLVIWVKFISSSSEFLLYFVSCYSHRFWSVFPANDNMQKEYLFFPKLWYVK